MPPRTPAAALLSLLQRLPSVTLPGSPRVDASGPSINTRAPPSAARVASAVAAAAAASPRSPLSGQARDTERPGPSAKSGGGSHMVSAAAHGPGGKGRGMDKGGVYRLQLKVWESLQVGECSAWARSRRKG